MKKTLLFLLFAYNTFAADYYVCGQVGGQDEFKIEINLKTEKAAFFDNKSWSILPLYSMSAPDLFIFRGTDAYLWPMKIDFDAENLQASVIETENRHRIRMVAESGCKAVKLQDLLSKI